ncbi:MAG TPA: hypothetical protein VK942_07785, partial [Actinomycetes bacterium]|nr:hypothetical protein [Actinomycetes bacterium]
LRTRTEKAFEKQSGMRLTRAKMTEYANAMRSCSRELARTGSPSDRLEPVYVTVKKACRTFDKGAKCWATAASVSMGSGGVITGHRGHSPRHGFESPMTGPAPGPSSIEIP